MTDTIETLVTEMFDKDGFSTINLFKNASGEWQCTANHRATGTYGIGTSKIALVALLHGLQKARKARTDVQRIIDGEHLKKTKSNLDDLL